MEGDWEWVAVSIICFFVSLLLVPNAQYKDEKFIVFVIGGPLMWGWFLFFFCWGIVEGISMRDNEEV